MNNYDTDVHGRVCDVKYTKACDVAIVSNKNKTIVEVEESVDLSQLHPAPLNGTLQQIEIIKQKESECSHGKCPRRSGVNWSSHFELFTKKQCRVAFW